VILDEFIRAGDASVHGADEVFNSSRRVATESMRQLTQQGRVGRLAIQIDNRTRIRQAHGPPANAFLAMKYS
jgi:hypothetical protein